MLLTCDVGGTFTDIALSTGHVAKVRTVPGDPAAGVVEGVSRVLSAARASPSEVTRVMHATTLGTNVILEERGGPVAFVTSYGWRDLLTLGRQAKVEEERYDRYFEPRRPPVAETYEIRERISSAGDVLVPLDERAGRKIAEALSVRAVAICLLHSYANPRHERRLAEIIGERFDGPVVCSHEVWPHPGEHDRACTTLMSAYVGPVMSDYLRGLAGRLAAIGIDAELLIMGSHGGAMTASAAAARPVETIESGPAAGVLAAADRSPDCVSFDMGGTTAKAGLVRDAQPYITEEFQVGGKGSFGGRRPGSGIPIKVPAIDLAEVGSGGGSLAWIDDGGTLRVGPRSAGADPGPACYGRGGLEPTVTDADVVLGYLDSFDHDLARAAMARIAAPLGVDIVTAAQAVHDIVNAQMGEAIHLVTVRRGIDPGRFPLFALGGAAPAHVARVAERFGISRILVPPHCGVGSALGLLSAPLTARRTAPALGLGPDELLAELVRLARAEIGPGRAGCELEVRYAGQTHGLFVGVEPPVDADQAAERFYELYRERYGIELRAPVEIASARVTVTVRDGPAPVDNFCKITGNYEGVRRAWFGGWREVPVRGRTALTEPTPGPLIVPDEHSALVVPPGWTASLAGEVIELVRPDG